VRAACQRHIDDLEKGAKRGLIFVPNTSALEYFPTVLRLNGGQFEGKPFQLLPFQQFIVGSIFGWRMKASGLRRFRVAYIEIGKGNGKSPLAAGIGLFCLTSDDEARAEVYAGATKKDQAMILFKDAVAMVDQSPSLQQRLVKTPNNERCHHLGYLKTGSYFRAIASEDKQSGPRPHCFLIDEVHEHAEPTMVNMAGAGQKWRRQPLTVEITNSGFDRTTICYEHHEYSRRVAMQLVRDDSWFAYVCALDEDDDPFASEACWSKANPGLGKIIQKTYLRNEVKQGRQMPAKRSSVQRLNFCMWVDAENPWIDGDLWRATEHEFDALEVLKTCERVVGGLDLSETQDLTALALTAEDRDGKVVARVEFWTPDDTAVDRGLEDHVTYREWIDDGHIHGVPGRFIDYQFVGQRIFELEHQIPGLDEIAFDPHRIEYLRPVLEELGSRVRLVSHKQGSYKTAPKKRPDGSEVGSLWMPRSIEVLSKDVVDGRLLIEKNPVLTWCAASAVLEKDSLGNEHFTKRKSRGRIDGIVALAMAEGLLHLTAEQAADLDDFINSPVIA
jgi:phage terminase large subunit-like protein